MPNSCCCYLNPSLKSHVTLNCGISTKTGPRNRPSSPPRLQLFLTYFHWLSSFWCFHGARGLSDFSVWASRKGSLTLGGTLSERPSDGVMLSLSNKFCARVATGLQREKPGSGSFSWESNGPLSHLPPPTASTGNWGTHRGRVLLLPWQAHWDHRCPLAALCLNQTCKLSSRSEMICHSLSAWDLICHLLSQAETMLAHYANSSLWSSTSRLRKR